jgi:uroporphyrinogen-III synthase
VTAEAARVLGIAVTLQPEEYTVPAMIDALEGFYARQPVMGSR